MTKEKFGGIENFFRMILSKDKPDFVKKYQEKFRNLKESEIRSIIGLVDEEVARSTNFGLMIKPEIIEKEKFFYLQATDSFGGVKKIVSREFVDVISLLTKTTEEIFSQERQYYSDYFQSIGERTTNKYDCHLQYFNGSFLNSLHNGLVK